MDKASQCKEIIRMLKRNFKSGVPNYRFAQAGILGYTARMSDLRKDGHVIVAERVWVDGKATGTFRYHLKEVTPSERKKGMRKFLGFKKA